MLIICKSFPEYKFVQLIVLNVFYVILAHVLIIKPHLSIQNRVWDHPMDEHYMKNHLLIRSGLQYILQYIDLYVLLVRQGRLFDIFEKYVRSSRTFFLHKNQPHSKKHSKNTLAMPKHEKNEFFKIAPHAIFWWGGVLLLCLKNKSYFFFL